MDDLELIARTYNMALRGRNQLMLELKARREAAAVYRLRHPSATEDDAMQATTRLIAEASRYIPEICWAGLGSEPVKPRRPDGRWW